MSSRPVRLTTQGFTFSLAVEVTNTLFLSAGELAELIAHGLTALDREGTLFPGVTEPEAGHRLTSVQLVATGFARRTDPTEVNHRYNRLMRGESRTPRPALKLMDQLDKAAGAVGEGIQRQRMLRAKLIAAANAIADSDNDARHDLAASQALLSVAESVVSSIQAATREVS